MARVNLIVDKASVGKLRKLLGTDSDGETVRGRWSIAGRPCRRWMPSVVFRRSGNWRISFSDTCGPRAYPCPTSSFLTRRLISDIRRKEHSVLVDRATESGRVVLSPVAAMYSMLGPDPRRRSDCWIGSSNR